MKLKKHLENTPTAALAAYAFMMELFIWGCDFLTGRLTGGQLSFSVFYLLPILFITWYGSRRYGIAFSILSALLWLLADVTSAENYLHPLIPLWNMTVRLMFFLMIMFLLSGIKQQQKQREDLISELREAMEKIRTLKGMLPICAWCKKIRNDEGYWQQVELYVQDHSDATFTHGICPDCLANIEKEDRD